LNSNSENPLPYLDLVFDIPSTQVFTYRRQEEKAGTKASAKEAVPGKRAMVPFGSRDMLGYIIGERESLPEGIKAGSVKALRRVVDEEPLFEERDLDLARWIAGYYFCGLGQALSAMIPSGKRAGSYPTLGGTEEISGFSLELSGEQQKALDAIIAPADEAPIFYLYGITGSGKTEVFLRAAEYFLNEGKSVIYLVPEISLTHQLAEAIGKRFGNIAAALHSGMSPANRLTEWMRIRRGEARIVLGPRSAVSRR
jgi:primosomal protein N' (replication factor Y)